MHHAVINSFKDTDIHLLRNRVVFQLPHQGRMGGIFFDRNIQSEEK